MGLTSGIVIFIVDLDPDGLSVYPYVDQNWIRGIFSHKVGVYLRLGLPQR